MLIKPYENAVIELVQPKPKYSVHLPPWVTDTFKKKLPSVVANHIKSFFNVEFEYVSNGIIYNVIARVPFDKGVEKLLLDEEVAKNAIPLVSNDIITIDDLLPDLRILAERNIWPQKLIYSKDPKTCLFISGNEDPAYSLPFKVEGKTLIEVVKRLGNVYGNLELIP